MIDRLILVHRVKNKPVCLAHGLALLLAHILADERIEGRDHNRCLLQSLEAENQEQNLFGHIKNGEDEIDSHPFWGSNFLGGGPEKSEIENAIAFSPPPL